MGHEMLMGNMWVELEGDVSSFTDVMKPGAMDILVYDSKRTEGALNTIQHRMMRNSKTLLLRTVHNNTESEYSVDNVYMNSFILTPID